MLKKMLLTLLLLDKQSVLDDVEQDLCLRYGADRVKARGSNRVLIKSSAALHFCLRVNTMSPCAGSLFRAFAGAGYA